MVGLPLERRNSLVWEKCLHPNHPPRLADKGDGCAASRTLCLRLSMPFPFAFAYPPCRKTETSETISGIGMWPHGSLPRGERPRLS